MYPVTVCQSTERGYALAPAGSSPAREAPELEKTPQKCPCISECRRPTSLAGILTPHPPEGIAEDLAGVLGGCHNVHVRREAVPQWDNKGSVVTGGMMSQCYPCRGVAPLAACACEALVEALVASDERWTHARGCNSGGPDEEPAPWSAHVGMFLS